MYITYYIRIEDIHYDEYCFEYKPISITKIMNNFNFFINLTKLILSTLFFFLIKYFLLLITFYLLNLCS